MKNYSLLSSNLYIKGNIYCSKNIEQLNVKNNNVYTYNNIIEKSIIEGDLFVNGNIIFLNDIYSYYKNEPVNVIKKFVHNGDLVINGNLLVNEAKCKNNVICYYHLPIRILRKIKLDSLE